MMSSMLSLALMSVVLAVLAARLGRLLGQGQPQLGVPGQPESLAEAQHRRLRRVGRHRELADGQRCGRARVGEHLLGHPVLGR